MLRVGAAAICAVALADPGLAKGPAPEPAAASASAAAPAQAAAATDQTDANKIVCKREDQIGSRLKAKKVCLTVHDWQERQREDQDTLHKLQQDTLARRSN